MILFLYIFRRVMRIFVFAFIGVIFLIALMNAIELLSSGNGVTVTLGQILTMALLQAPSVSMKALPFVMLLSGMWAFITLARSSEFVAARSAGHTYVAQAFAGMMAAFVVGVFAICIYGPLSAAALNGFERLEASIFDEGGNFLSVSNEGIWLRESLSEGHAVLRAARSTNPDGTQFFDVSYFRFGAGDVLSERIDAELAQLGDGVWEMAGVRSYSVPGNRDASVPNVVEHLALNVSTKLTAEEILNSVADPETISVWQMPTVIAGMEEAGFSARRHKTHFHGLLALPVFLAAMTLISAAFAIRPPRTAKFGWIALGCALSGFVFYFVSDVAMALAASGGAPVIMGAWSPALAAMLLGVAFSLVFGDA